MTKNITLVICLTTGLLNGCAKDENTPSKSLPLNTLQLTVKGKSFPVDLTRTTLKVYKPSNGNHGTLSLFTPSSTTAEEFTISAVNTEPNASVETPGEFYTDHSQLRAQATYFFVEGTAGYRFETNYCGVNNQTFKLKIESVDKAAHTISGSFSGDLCKGNDPIVKVENGKFNLPYTVEP
ncbi:hypothetical protein [Hymenobacter wooponensis]|uniref:Uncharacterized protein n=1 Tax=Hymenobacter wooponensis TaxID=1525360 RepID=A0A4Z0MD12_9BACT|nr:hypothetical protein [Hymenobacter wooponensis]TGD77632.1 hypothetical protein EU557_22925 [Hymenobacter wooponensis]